MRLGPRQDVEGERQQPVAGEDRGRLVELPCARSAGRGADRHCPSRAGRHARANSSARIRARRPPSRRARAGRRTAPRSRPPGTAAAACRRRGSHGASRPSAASGARAPRRAACRRAAARAGARYRPRRCRGAAGTSAPASITSFMSCRSCFRPGNQQFGGVPASRNGSNWLIPARPMASATRGRQPIAAACVAGLAPDARPYARCR